MAAQWQRISQMEPFIGRAGSVGDILGARLIASRLIHDLMQLAFYLEKQYAPYEKWFGTAFLDLALGLKLTPIFQEAIKAETWQAIEENLSETYLLVMEAHNQLGVTPPMDTKMSQFYNRPFSVPHAGRFVESLLANITDPQILALPPHVGSIDQVVDNTDVLEDIPTCQSLKMLYQKTKAA